MSFASREIQYCLPIIRASVSAVLNDIKTAPPEYRIIEVWLDYILDLSPSSLAEITSVIGKRTALYLFRRQNLEVPRMEASSRSAYLKDLPATTMVDFDMRTQLEDITWCRKYRPELPLVLSYHNYQETPALSELRAIADEMELNSASTYKFSTFCNNESDALLLMSFLLELRSAKRHAVVLGMGKLGMLTRVVAPLLGSEIAYAPQEVANSSAPGQLTLRQLTIILQELMP